MMIAESVYMTFEPWKINGLTVETDGPTDVDGPLAVDGRGPRSRRFTCSIIIL